MGGVVNMQMALATAMVGDKWTGIQAEKITAPMKVYIVEVLDDSWGDNCTSPHKAFSSEQKAQDYIDSHQDTYIDCATDDECGYYISTIITELVIE